MLDLHVVQMITQNGSPVCIRRRKNSVPISTFARDTLTFKVHFFLVSSVVEASKIVTRIDAGNLILEKNDSRETFPQ